MKVIAAVQSALDANLFYTRDVLAHAIVQLGVTPEQAERNYKMRVEGGVIGMDTYYARCYIDAQAKAAAERVALQIIKPHVGQKLGTLMFNDFKRNTGMVVVAVSEGGKMITLKGKRGAYSVSLACTAKNIEYAINRAAEKGLRKDNFAMAFAPTPLCSEQPEILAVMTMQEGESIAEFKERVGKALGSVKAGPHAYAIARCVLVENMLVPEMDWGQAWPDLPSKTCYLVAYSKEWAKIARFPFNADQATQAPKNPTFDPVTA